VAQVVEPRNHEALSSSPGTTKKKIWSVDEDVKKKGFLVHCDDVYTLQETVWRFLKKLKIKLP
jgi:hypothetical protein